ncbi:long-chain fatty acid--CoA ligase [Cytophagales bacterium LB-30]|uniref:Long-chain fatty acid--CoA ligase n=1 Tax=Shiella aurantiaca TaxID=3058365 RepID=A0ABT8F5S0_9BACT|nr:long-chain fatty acid--CoA ligase [Shiella aurantiaca]MDN4165594.1 long-chain fatty acid--CoA ligase [Shiella aurantiaca]
MTPTRLFDIFQLQLQNFPRENALNRKVNGEWVSYSTQKIVEIVDQLALGLYKKGISKGSKVAIASENRPEWNFVDMALQKIGAISVPLYVTVTVDTYQFILNDAEVKLAFVSNKELYDKMQQAAAQVSWPVEVFTFDKLPELPYWESVLRKADFSEQEIVTTLSEEVLPSDLLTIIYTSGTTGVPKGVMLSHSNVLSNALAVRAILPWKDTHHMRTVSFLPLSHIFERTASYFFQYAGIAVYYAESMETVGDNIREIKPHLFATVPRMLEKVYERIIGKGRELTGIKKALFFWAMSVGEKYLPQENQGFLYDTKLKLANKLIFSKWREALGGNVQLIISGGAALQPRLATLFWAAQIPTLEAYGLTETSPGVCFNRLDIANMRIGTVGPVLPGGIEIKIAEDGEVLCKGPNIMMGYYKRPDLTAEVIDADGWFHTGDIGELVEGKFLKIVDRKKEMFKTSGGKYIAPQLMENKFKESSFIEQILVTGESQKFPSALIVPNFEHLRKWCELHNIPYTTDSQMITFRQVVERYEKEMERYNAQFASYEQIKKFTLLKEPFSIDKGELTAKLSLRRKQIETNYAEAIKGMYT